MANDSYGTFFSESRIPYDPLWDGPLKKNRHCTNRLWLIAFSAFVIIWAIIAGYAFSKGDIQKLIVPTDHEGRKCGVDFEVVDKPYLLFFDLTQCANGTCNTPQVCQTKCPTENFLYQSKVGDLDTVKNKIICENEINLNLNTTWEVLDNLVAEQKCTKWYLKSTSILNRCIPSGQIPAEFSDIISKKKLDYATTIVKQLANLESRLENVYKDIVKTRYPVLGFIALSGAAAFFYIILLRWLAKPFVYVTIFIICSLLVYFIYESSVQYSINNSSDWLYVLIFCISSFIVIVLSTIFLRKRIDLACSLIKESSKAVSCVWTSLFFPVLPWLLHLLVIIFAGAVLFSLQTISEPQYQIQEALDSINADLCVCPPQLNYVNNATCDPNIFKTECKDSITGGECITKGCHQTSATTPDQIYIYHLINALGFLWISFFISAVRHMVLATTFATWYWTFNKRNLPNLTVIRSFWLTCRYHVGTLAFGSLIMWICDIIRIFLKPIVRLRANGTLSARAVGFFGSIVEFLMSFLQYINRNAYTMCAIHGNGFCRSAKDAFNLITRNIARVYVITNITDWLLRIAKYLIVAATVALTMMYYNNENSGVNSLEVPATMALIGSYLITTVFLSVYKAAVDTVFLCFLEDSERNDGSQDRPYYMSMRLKQLLQK